MSFVFISKMSFFFYIFRYLSENFSEDFFVYRVKFLIYAENS